MKFEYYRKSNTADIKHSKEDDIIPHPENPDYLYRPKPVDLIPPVGKNQLIHFLQTPHTAEDSAQCFDRLPKKVTGQLVDSGATGWGLHIVDGLDRGKFAVFIITTIGIIGGTLFGTLWSIYKENLSDAFSVAAYMMAASSAIVVCAVAMDT